MLRALLFVGVVLVASGAVLSLAAPGAADDAVPMPQSFAETIVACDQLDIDSRDAETNTVLDLEHHLLMIDLPGSDEPVTIDYTDPECSNHPVIGPLVRDVLDEEREDMATECQSLRDQVARGRVEARGFVLDIQKVQAHIDRWCTANAIP